MLDSFLFQNIATARLEQSATLEGEAVFVRLPGGIHEARLEPEQWKAILERHHRTAHSSRRQLLILMMATIPLAVAVLGIVYNVPWLRVLFQGADRLFPAVLPLLLASGLPLVAIVRHAFAVQQSVNQARAELRAYPVFPVRHRPPPREAGPIMKVALFAIIPTLVIQTYGSFNPDAYRNTPWTGTNLGASSVLLAAVLAALLIARWRSALKGGEQSSR